MPNSVNDTELQETVTKIAKSLNVELKSNDVEACHRLKSKPGKNGPKRTIVRFVNRRNVENLLSKKKLLKGNSFVNIDKLSNETRLFLSDHLCPYYNKIFGMCEKLRFNNKINSVWSYNGEVFFKMSSGDEKGEKVKNELFLKNKFPDFFTQ